jgi:membrane-associated phospholipid phosphatase
MSLIAFLKRLDKIFFLLINHDSFHRYLDSLMLFLQNPLTWVPLYLFILWFLIKNAGRKEGQFIMFSLICVAATDSSSILLQNVFKRPLPFYDLEIRSLVRHLVNGVGVYSFPSSDAANYFGMATCWFWLIFKWTCRRWTWLWIWAGLIGYALIYVGREFPSDVAAGSLMGILVGTVMAKAAELFQA